MSRRRAGRVVKSLNQLAYDEFEESRRPLGAPGRVSIAVAGDDWAAVLAVMELVDRLGFDPVDAGPPEAGGTRAGWTGVRSRPEFR